MLVMIISLLFGCGEKADKLSDANSSYKIGDKIVIKSVTNTTVTIVRENSGFKIENSDKILIFDIFGTYCQPCITEAPQLTDFQLKYKDDVLLIGLIYGENVSDKYILENFSKPMDIRHFISNSPENRRIVNNILKDINYPYELAIPFKVVLKNGIYQELTNVFGITHENNKFYIGKTDMLTLQKDIIKSRSRNF
ncbi:MAG: TlpA family protein disulfide reductase [Campylobacteraceae bacterium]|nr:TlpA family protein disulfide reductase [Campylobacteraceae bacterium]